MAFKLWPFSRKSDTASNPMDILRAFLQGPSTKSGVPITHKTALQAVTAFACARVISEALAQVPFRIMRLEGRDRQPARDHPHYDLLAVEPNEWMNSFELRELIGIHLAFAGRAYIYKVRGRGDRVVELLPYEPNMVRVKREGWRLRYWIRLESGSEQEVPAADMWHLRGPSWNGWEGLDGVRLAAEAIGLALATEEHGARMFSNGAQPGGLLSTDAKLNPEQSKDLKESWQAAQAGVRNAHKTVVLYGGMKWTPMAQQNDQAQFLETRRFQVEEVCRAFGVLPISIGHADKAQTYASSEQQYIAEARKFAVWYQRVEYSADVAMLTPDDRKAGYYTKFFQNALLRGAMKDRADYYSKLYAAGAINPNEIREFEDMNPYEGGDSYRVPLNMEDPANPDNQGNSDGNPAP